MDKQEITSLISTIALFLGGWTVIVNALAIFISQLVTKRLFNEWDKKNQIEIENLRHLQSENQLILKEMVGTISSNQSQILDRRIEAIDKLWSSVIGLRIEFSSVIMFFNVAYPEEYMTKTTKSLPLLKDINQSSVLNSSVKYSEFDNYRPYFGETLWQVIYIYRGFLTRLGILVTRIKDNEEVKNWKEDELISKQLKALLSEDEYNEIQKTQLGAITITLAFLENKLVSEINNILSGRQSSLEGILNSIEMQKIIAKSSQTY